MEIKELKAEIERLKNDLSRSADSKFTDENLGSAESANGLF